MPSTSSTDLIDRLRARAARLGVIGLGYVGLPLAVEFAKAGFTTVGFDVDEDKVRRVSGGDPCGVDVSRAAVEALTASGRLTATTDFTQLAGLDSVTICVPTPLRKTKDPDLSYIVAAVGEIAKHLHAGQLVVLESTTFPGTVEDVVRPMLEEGGLHGGEDFFLAFSPERIDPGNREWTTANIPKVVGGVDATSTAVAQALYEQVVSTVVPVSSTRVAEMVKLLENTFRAVNIGLVNELALMSHELGVDVVGGDRRGKYETVRFHAVLPRTWARRALHPDRSIVPELEGTPKRVREPVHRARRTRQLRDAPVYGGARRRGAEPRP